MWGLSACVWGVECVCVKGSLVLVLDWTGLDVSSQPCSGDARLASPKNWVAGPPERRGRWIQFPELPPADCGPPTTSRLSVWCSTYPSSPQSTYDMTINCKKTYELLPTTGKTTGHNLQKTQSPLPLRPPYPTTHRLPI